MQLALEKPILHRSKKIRQIPPRFSSASPNQLDKVGVIKAMPVIFEKKEQHERKSDFTGWSMPEQETGVIKCREHDFL
ncbi:MAG: hypothetical protein ACXWV6_13210 [Chitinophagaceae bacterium]